MPRINPRIDFAFKKLFGSEENKDLLLSLINAVLEKEEPITYIELKNPYSLSNYTQGKMSILDIKACDDKDQWFNIEMQVGEDLYFDKRAIYYWAKLVTEQLEEGHLYKKLKPTYSINILDFDFLSGIEDYHSRYKILNVKSYDKKDQRKGLHDIFELHYIELRKFNKQFPELKTSLERWIAFLTHAHELDKQHLPDSLATDPCITKAINSVGRLFNEEERLIYETRMKAFLDVESQLDSAHEKGLREGRVEGHAKGRTEERLDNARKMLTKGLEMKLISEITGLSQEEIDHLKS